LGYSRLLYVRAFRNERQESWFAGVEGAFRHFGGITEEVLLDEGGIARRAGGVGSQCSAGGGTRADRVGSAWNERPMTVQDAARLVRHDQQQGDKRWQEMGFVRQETGVRPDHALGINEGVERMAVEALDKLEPRRAELARQLPQAENEEAAAFARAQPAAAAELATRQERGNLAREILAERRQQDREQEQARERQQELRRDRGIER
jgi:hypothetical protein